MSGVCYSMKLSKAFFSRVALIPFTFHIHKDIEGLEVLRIKSDSVLKSAFPNDFVDSVTDIPKKLERFDYL
jgi:hypothetical protein